MPDIVSPNVGFVSPVDTSPMSDITTYLNNNWTKVEGMSPKVVSSVPDTDATYKPGDRIYVNGGSDPNGIYICLEVDPTWGTIWRPITPLYGPWRRPGPVAIPSNVLADSYYQIIDTNSPFQYRFSNRGTIELRGCVQTDPANGSAFFKLVGTVGYSAPLFKPFPPSMRPGYNLTGWTSNVALTTTPYPLTASATEAQYSSVVWDPTQNTFVYRVFSNVNAIKKLFFSAARYNLGVMGTMEAIDG